MKRPRVAGACMIGMIVVAAMGGCEKHADALTPAEKKIVQMLNNEEALFRTSGRAICVRIADRLHIYTLNGLYDDSGFEQTYQTYLDIGVKQGCMRPAG